MATSSTFSLSTVCSSANFQAPTALPGQTVTFCVVDTFGNHTNILRSCCNSSHGTITSSTDGCNVYCDIDVPLLNITRTCLENNAVVSFCGQSNITGPALPSSSSSTGTSTNSAALPHSSDSAGRFTRGKIMLGIVVLLVVSMIY